MNTLVTIIIQQFNMTCQIISTIKFFHLQVFVPYNLPLRLIDFDLIITNNSPHYTKCNDNARSIP